MAYLPPILQMLLSDLASWPWLFRKEERKRKQKKKEKPSCQLLVLGRCMAWCVVCGVRRLLLGLLSQGFFMPLALTLLWASSAASDRLLLHVSRPNPCLPAL